MTQRPWKPPALATVLAQGPLRMGCHKHQAGTHAGRTGCTDLGPSSPPLSSPRRPGKAPLPSLLPAALPMPRASQPGTAQDTAGPGARGALRMRRVLSSPQRGRRGCPCPRSPRQWKGGDTRLCPGSWRGIGKSGGKGKPRLQGCFSSTAHRAVLFALVTPCLI